MANNIDDLNKYKQGYYLGLQAIEQGKSEEETSFAISEQEVLEGIHEAYHEELVKVFKDSVVKLKEAVASRSIEKLTDASHKVIEAQTNINLHIQDSIEGYEVKKESENKVNVLKDNKVVYSITKSPSGKWECSCTGFKYRGTCKHLHLLKGLQGQTERLPQHLARVRNLEKSLSVWQQRLEENPNNKVAKKNVEIRTKALEEAKKKAEEIESLPKPTRHPREEFEGVIPSLDSIFKGLGKYEIVGSWRRGKPDYKDCDILTVMSPEDWEVLKERLNDDVNFGPAPGRSQVDFGDEVIRGGYKNGDRVDYLDINRVPNPDEWGAWLLFRTGSAQFNIAMRGWLKKFGCGLNERGLIGPDGDVVASKTEQEIFDAIGIPFIEPSAREDAKRFYQEVRKLDKPKFLGGKNKSQSVPKWRVEYQNEEGDSLAVDVRAYTEEQAKDIAQSNYPDINIITTIYQN